MWVAEGERVRIRKISEEPNEANLSSTPPIMANNCNIVPHAWHMHFMFQLNITQHVCGKAGVQRFGFYWWGGLLTMRGAIAVVMVMTLVVTMVALIYILRAIARLENIMAMMIRNGTW